MGIDGKGLYQEITDHETIGIYHAYTNEEIAQQKADAEAKAAEEKQAAAINALPTQMTQMQSALCDVYEQLLSKYGGRMEYIYAALIKKGIKTIEDVPEVIRDKVKAVLEQN